jgi:hypothetical protein
MPGFSDSATVRGKYGALATTLAGKPTARQRGGIVLLTSEFAPMTAPSPIFEPARTNTRHESETLLPISIGLKSTG